MWITEHNASNGAKSQKSAQKRKQIIAGLAGSEQNWMILIGYTLCPDLQMADNAVVLRPIHATCGRSR